MSAKLASLTVENYKRIEIASATFDTENGGVVAIGGNNEQGKSSYLDALEALVAGRSTPKVSRPIKKGATSSRIVGTFVEDGHEIVIERVYRENGTTALVVRQDGLKVEKSDTILSRFYSHIAIDPHGFARLPSKEQVDTLVRLTGFDPAPLDDEHRNTFATRTEVGRDVKRLTGALEQYGPARTDLGDAIDVAATSAQLQEAHAQLRAAADLETEADLAEDGHRRAIEEVTRLRNELALAEGYEVTAKAARVEARERSAHAPRPDVAPLQEKLATAEAHNAAVREQADRQRVAAELKDVQNRQRQLTDRLAAIVKEKAAGFAGVEMPVDGLTIEDGEVMLDGTPFSQTSPGGRLRTSVLIAIALNPDLHAIVIRDGALLDDANRKVIDDIATERDFLVLIEVVGTSTEPAIVFEDGKIISPAVNA